MRKWDITRQIGSRNRLRKSTSWCSGKSDQEISRKIDSILLCIGNASDVTEIFGEIFLNYRVISTDIKDSHEHAISFMGAMASRTIIRNCNKPHKSMHLLFKIHGDILSLSKVRHTRKHGDKRGQYRYPLCTKSRVRSWTVQGMLGHFSIAFSPFLPHSTFRVRMPGAKLHSKISLQCFATLYARTVCTNWREQKKTFRLTFGVRRVWSMGSRISQDLRSMNRSKNS